MKRIIWWLVFSVLIPWNAIAGRMGAGQDRAGEVSPSARAPKANRVSVDGHTVTRMCQSFRFKDGKPIKVGEPHPCKEPRNLRLSSNLTGGRYLPQ